jgi:hypothetical protein
MDLAFVRNALLRCAKPYSHLYHADGSLYMERFLVVERRDEDQRHVRLHHIVTKDYDHHLHDHPFDFWSLVLTGGYIEVQPLTRGPCFYQPPGSYVTDDLREEVRPRYRYAGSLAFVRACDRHRIVSVLPNTWTLVFASPLRQWWGFYTPVGKIHWRDYHKTSPNAREER